MVEIDEALRLIETHSSPLEPLALSLDCCVGRVLSEPEIHVEYP